MSMGNISDVMVECRKGDNVAADMRSAVDVFLTIQGTDPHAIGIIVTEDDVTLAVREDGHQYLYIVQTPTEAGAATEYTIMDAVNEMLEVAEIRTTTGDAFATDRKFETLGIEGVNPGELDASVCDNLNELEDALNDVLDARVIDWA